MTKQLSAACRMSIMAVVYVISNARRNARARCGGIPRPVPLWRGTPGWPISPVGTNRAVASHVIGASDARVAF